MISDLIKIFNNSSCMLFANKEWSLIIWGIMKKHGHAGQIIAYLTPKTGLLSLIFTLKNSIATLFLVYFLNSVNFDSQMNCTFDKYK